MYLEASSFKVVSRLPPRRQARRPQWRRPVAPKGVSGMVEVARGVARRGARRQHVSHAPRAAAGGRGRCGDEAGLTAMANPRYRGSAAATAATAAAAAIPCELRNCDGAAAITRDLNSVRSP